MESTLTSIGGQTELIDGHEIQKPLAKRLHSIIQVFLIQWFGRELPVGFDIGSELNVLCGPDRLVADVTIADASARYEQGDLADPALIAVEILSPGQTISDLFDKGNRLLRAGVKTCWIIWPEKRRTWIYTRQDLTEVSDELYADLHTGGKYAATVRVPLPVMWNELTRRGL